VFEVEVEGACGVVLVTMKGALVASILLPEEPAVFEAEGGSALPVSVIVSWISSISISPQRTQQDDVSHSTQRARIIHGSSATP